MSKELFLTQGKVSQIDDGDYEMLKVLSKRWCINDGYAYNSTHGRLHRFLLGASGTDMVDHINGDKLDNRRVNLRLCSNSQNQANRKAVRGVSPFKGVTWQRRPDGTGTWKAQIVLGGKTLYLGAFKTDLMAAAAYNESASEHFGEFAHLNDLTTPASAQESSCAVRRQVNRSNSHGLKGVTFDKDRARWMAQLSYKGVTYLKKRFPTAEAAARAYDEVARKVHGRMAACNY